MSLLFTFYHFVSACNVYIEQKFMYQELSLRNYIGLLILYYFHRHVILHLKLNFVPFRLPWCITFIKDIVKSNVSLNYD